jgi:hypothetical protein
MVEGNLPVADASGVLPAKGTAGRETAPCVGAKRSGRTGVPAGRRVTASEDRMGVSGGP